MSGFLALFRWRAGRPPERPAITFPERTLSYRELARASAAVAAAVRGRRRVAVLAEPRLETCVAVIGALRAGVPVVPINPRSGERELGHIVGDAEPELLLLGPGTEAPPALSAARCVVDLDAAAPRPALGRPDDRSRGPGADRLHVGDDRSRPRARCSRTAHWPPTSTRWPTPGPGPTTDTVAHGLPLFHVHGLVVGILGPIRRGGSAVHLGRFTPQAIGAALRGGATMVFGVPTMYRRLAEAAEADPRAGRRRWPRARLLISGSAPLPVAEHERLTRLTGRGVLERYGMTETLMNTAVRADREPGPGTVGEPYPAWRCAWSTTTARRSRSLTTRRWARSRSAGRTCSWATSAVPEATAEAMRDGWFRTGDMATRDGRGYIRIVGRRATDLIKSGGYKIGAGEIEAALREHPAVEDAAVAGEPDADLGERVSPGWCCAPAPMPTSRRAGRSRRRAAGPPQAAARASISWTSSPATSWARCRSSDWPTD